MPSIKDIPWAQLLTQNNYHPSPRDWSDQVIYFLLVDRFSDGLEDGYKDLGGQTVSGYNPNVFAGRRRQRGSDAG